VGNVLVYFCIISDDQDPILKKWASNKPELILRDTENACQGGIELIMLVLSVYFCADMHGTLLCRNYCPGQNRLLKLHSSGMYLFGGICKNTQVSFYVSWACWKEPSIFNEEELGFANYSSFRYNDPNCGEINYIGFGLESRS